MNNPNTNELAPIGSEREAFEKWAVEFMGLDITPNDSCGYVSPETNGAWLGWGAERRQAMGTTPPAAPVSAEPVAWENFPSYLIDQCEGDTITEESIQRALAAMLKDPKYAAQAQPYIDSTPELHVGDSSFESWYSDYLLNAPVHRGAKQHARDAYAAGMGDPLVVARAQPDQSMPYETALAELIDKIIPGLDTGDILADARQASAALAQQDAGKASTQAVEYDIEAAAKTIAKRMYCSWEHMPEKGRSGMRLHARAVIDAARKEANRDN